MTRITYIEPDGTAHAVDVTQGTSVMKGAVRNGIPGIAAICGGACACGTCHVYVDEAWLKKATPKSVAEEALLGVLDDVRPNSRLACQIAVSDRLDRLVVRIPAPRRG